MVLYVIVLSKKKDTVRDVNVCIPFDLLYL